MPPPAPDADFAGLLARVYLLEQVVKAQLVTEGTLPEGEEGDAKWREMIREAREEIVRVD